MFTATYLHIQGFEEFSIQLLGMSSCYLPPKLGYPVLDICTSSNQLTGNCQNPSQREYITQRKYLGEKLLSESRKGNLTFKNITCIYYIAIYKMFLAINT